MYSIGKIVSAPRFSDTQRNSKAIIGADKIMHCYDGRTYPLFPDSTIEGYDAEGVSDYVWYRLRGYCRSKETTDDNGDPIVILEGSSDDIKEAIACALERIGFV